MFDFVQFEENATKHRTVNNQHAKTLHTVNNNYKKQTKQTNRRTENPLIHAVCFSQCIIKSLLRHCL